MFKKGNRSGGRCKNTSEVDGGRHRQKRTKLGESHVSQLKRKTKKGTQKENHQCQKANQRSQTRIRPTDAGWRGIGVKEAIDQEATGERRKNAGKTSG